MSCHNYVCYTSVVGDHQEPVPLLELVVPDDDAAEVIAPSCCINPESLFSYGMKTPE